MWKVRKGEEYVTKSFRLPLMLMERMAGIASRNNVSLNELVFQSLNYALENLDEADETQAESNIAFKK